eukprot:CAMPEP_0196572354 /NCGR_PEP_ID=MMETSP1081-20130531/2423_1 /TAXON_ID=36882 /ORGANISM="Pyramimonas amylifera, Strain CCMP720" /LENGTH=421 /DNA_ID=CAMNT_0041889653 /DNA_START=21 /DNA_END=1286 /DNA_ORIENTATION=+
MELLPLSPAICCRPCLPETYTGDLSEREHPVAVVTTTCQTSSSKNQEQCGEDTAGEFLQGFEQVVPTERSFFPRGAAQCCSASLLLSSGLIQPLKHCHCQPPQHSSLSSISCGRENTLQEAERGGQLVTGFEHSLSIDGMYPVPSAPVQCCSVCIDHSIAPLKPEDCGSLSYCHAHGRCRFGQCECEDGWSGSDCSQGKGKGKSKDNGHSFNQTWLLVAIFCTSGMFICCCKCLTMLRALLLREIRRAENQSEDVSRREMEEPMLRASEEPADVDTSAEEWSTDLESEEEDEGVNTSPSRRPEESGEPAVLEARELPEPEGTEARSPAILLVEGGDEPEGRGLMEQCGVEPMQQEEVPPSAVQGASQVHIECAVCMSARIQVVCVPCGHACMCRKCSRRLRRCPMCRVEVTRRQKLYINLD